jgi:DNA-binding NarL/FixJ family response regulator
MGKPGRRSYHPPMHDAAPSGDLRTRFDRLTPREVEVLGLVASGLTNAEAATRLGVGAHAVKFHLAAIYRRLGVANRTEAAVTYFQHLASETTTQQAG